MKTAAITLGLLLMAATVAHAGLRLQWQDASTNEANFHVERKDAACSAATGTFIQIATTGAGVTTFNDTAVTEGQAYCYRVAASNPGGKSGFSNTAGDVAPFTIPAPPSGLTVTPGL